MQMPKNEECSSDPDQKDDMMKSTPPTEMPKKEKCSGDCGKKDGLVKSPLIEMPQEKGFGSGFDQDDDVKIVPPLQMPKKEKCSGDCGKEDDNLFSKTTPTSPSASGTKVLIVVDGRPKVPQPSSGSILQESSGELRPPPISNKFSGLDTLAPPNSDQSLFDPSQKNPQASNIPIINANANSGIVFNAAAVKIRTPCSTTSIALILSFVAFLLSN
ncbi:hypothetical protein GcM3_093025 [Golovinomyces cichoracearum]|uniref:Uncharacterized protein n=1 Tax=Golovinomyces cichoracearum TaxID=62708 RepID=A0A420IGH1_9PEZI|nr:hypothetical protein GcM3_093025 [Golovinomyces cichoracearum]